MRGRIAYIFRSIATLTIALFLSSQSLLLFFAPKAYAEAPYLASDVLGQTDRNGNPVFNKNEYNNGQLKPGATGLDSPQSPVIDTVDHRLFVVDRANNRVLVYQLNSNNLLTDRIADFVLGQADFTGNSPNFSQNTFNQPAGLAYDTLNHYLFVSDSTRVVVFDLSGGITNGMNASFILGQADFSLGGGYSCTAGGSSAGAALLYEASQKHLYVVDKSMYRVVVFDLSGGITNGMNASYVLGQPDLTTCSGPDSNAKGFRFYNENSGLAYDSNHGYLYVADTQNYRVLVFDMSGGISNNMDASYVLGQANFTDNASSGGDAKGFNNGGSGVGTLVYDNTNNLLYASDTWNSRVLVFDMSGGISNNMDASYVLGQSDLTSIAWGTTSADLGGPAGIAYDEAHQVLFLADIHNRVLEFDVSSGIVNHLAAIDVLGQTDVSGTLISIAEIGTT